jgi:MFS family permease
LPAIILSRGLQTFAFFAGDAFVTLTITTVLHHGTAIASLAITGSTLAWAAGAWLQVRLGRRWPWRDVIRLGLTLILTGIVGMVASLRGWVPVGEAVAAWTIAGMGIGLAYAPISLMTLREASAGREGWASASLNLAEVLGIALGTGIAGAAIALGSYRGWSTSTAVTVAFGIAGLGAVAALAVTQRLPLRSVARGAPEAGPKVVVGSLDT